jgi:apolipoprotein N-acyltransferase
LNEKEKRDHHEKNIGILFTPEGEKAWEYAKAFPGPGFEDIIVEAGQGNIPYADTPYDRMGQVICADMLSPHFMKQASEKEIDLLMVPSFDSSIFAPLLTYSSAYRAVENGFTMIRIAGGDGRSVVIDPYYRQWAGQDCDKQNTKNFYANAPVVSINTFYAAIGFIFPYFIVLLLLSMIVVPVIRAVKKQS